MSKPGMKPALISLLVICGALAACRRKPEPTSLNLAPAPTGSVSSPAPLATPAAHADQQAAPLEVTWQDPPSWRRLPNANGMRRATYRPPRAAGDGEDPELVVFYFGPRDGGGVEANVTRWIRQFPDVKPESVRREDRHANGLLEHTVEIKKGSFLSGMPGSSPQSKAMYGLLGAIVETPSGAYFFKLTGPSASVEAAHDAFYKLLDSVKVAG